MADREPKKPGSPKKPAPELKGQAKPSSVVSPSSNQGQGTQEKNVLNSPQKKKPSGNENPADKQGPSLSAKAVSEPLTCCLSQELSNEPLKLAEKSSNQGDEGDMQAQGQKSKSQLRAERRAIQEAQRKAKEEKKAGVAVDANAKAAQSSTSQAGKKSEVVAGVATEKKTLPSTTEKKVQQSSAAERKVQPAPVSVPSAKKEECVVREFREENSVSLFSHLRRYNYGQSLTRSLTFRSSGIHPAILKLGVQYASGVVCGSNARCIGLLDAFKKVIRDYTTPPQKELSRDLAAAIKPYIAHLSDCRPLSVSMASAIKFLKHQINHMPGNTTDEKAKDLLCDAIDTFYKDRIENSDDEIAHIGAKQKISSGDVILTYAWSSLVLHVLTKARRLGKDFRVIVVDSRPRQEGRKMLRRLTQEGIPCTYVLINSVSYIMKEVTKVFVGAHSLLANGYVMSRCGTSQVALVAHAYGVPVLVCCETYKFSERVQTDSFVWNELGDPDELVRIGSHLRAAAVAGRRDRLTFLNLVYDVTPSKYVTMVITEVGMIPCTSAPVVLRVKQSIDE